jgi:tetratricopeptide (TPR) repeat protein
VVLPSQDQVDRREWLRMLQKLGVDEVDLGPIDMEYPNKVLGEFCLQQRIPYIDLYQAFATADNVEDLYLTVIGDGHLSARGHALVAREVGIFLQDGPLKYRSPVVGLYRTGLCAAELGDQAAAENSLKEACALRPDWSAPADALADLYLQQRRWQEAQILYRQVLDIAPQRKQTWAKLGALLDTVEWTRCRGRMAARA